MQDDLGAALAAADDSNAPRRQAVDALGRLRVVEAALATRRFCPARYVRLEPDRQREL